MCFLIYVPQKSIKKRKNLRVRDSAALLYDSGGRLHHQVTLATGGRVTQRQLSLSLYLSRCDLYPPRTKGIKSGNNEGELRIVLIEWGVSRCYTVQVFVFQGAEKRVFTLGTRFLLFWEVTLSGHI